MSTGRVVWKGGQKGHLRRTSKKREEDLHDENDKRREREKSLVLLCCISPPRTFSVYLKKGKNSEEEKQEGKAK